MLASTDGVYLYELGLIVVQLQTAAWIECIQSATTLTHSLTFGRNASTLDGPTATNLMRLYEFGWCFYQLQIVLCLNAWRMLPGGRGALLPYSHRGSALAPGWGAPGCTSVSQILCAHRPPYLRTLATPLINHKRWRIYFNPYTQNCAQYTMYMYRA